MLKIGVQTKGILPEYEVEEGLQMIKDAGFERIDFNMDTFLKNTAIYAGNLNNFFDHEIETLGAYFLPYVEAMEKVGIVPSQMHAPYPVHVHGRGQQNEYMQGNVIPKCLILAEFLKVPYVIIHPFKLQYVLGIEEERRTNIEYFKLLIPLLKQCHVKVCFENLYEGIGNRLVEGVCADPEDAVWYIDTLNEMAGEELFGFCLDTGHLQLVKRDPYQFIKRLGHRLKCLHLHENDAIGDLHQMPYSFGSQTGEGQDWDGILRGLKEIHFNGTLSFETFPCAKTFPKPMVRTVLKTIHGIGAYFRDTIGDTDVYCDATRVRVGVIGTGRIAARFAQDAARVEHTQLTAVYNIHKDSAQRYAAEHGIACATDEMTEFLEQVDAVYIAAPHEYHVQYARAALEAGKHVLCEKPMAFAREEAEQLYALAKSKGCILQEAVKTAFCPGYLALLEMARSGKIGEIRDVEACFSKLTATNLRELTDLQYGGSVTELGSYVLLPILQLLGTDYRNVTFSSIDAENGLDLYTKMMFEYPDGMGTAKIGLGVKSEGQLVIAGTKGYILSESPWWLTRRFEVRYEDSNRREVYEYPFEGSGLQYELAAFLERIEGTELNRGLTETESIAIADIMQRFLKQNADKRSQKAKELALRIPKVGLWAHRGCCMNYPENTLQAFRAAADLPQVKGIELDVQLTRDGEVVVTHDENVSRVTNGTRYVCEYTLEELQKLTITAGTGVEYIPTLREVLQLLEQDCKSRGFLINIELKTSVIHYEGIEEKTLALVSEYGLEDYVVYSSFWAESLKLIRSLAPNAKTGMLAGSLSDCIKWGRYAQVDALHPWIGGMDCRIPEDMRQMPVRAYNGEEPFCGDGRVLKERELRKYAMYGVTEVFTNVPEIYEA